ncbi:MAG: ArnT family glycosyltransferase [Draconibacterium sp.]
MKNKKNTTQKKEYNIQKIYPFLLLLIFFVAYKFIFNSHLDLNGDNFDYINYAKSILDGHGYRSPYTPEYIPTNHYPPGYSMLLAISMFFVGKNVVIFKILNGLFFVGSIILLGKAFESITKNKFLTFSVSAILLVNTGLLQWSTIVMSEMPYLFFSSLGFYFVVKYFNNSQENKLSKELIFITVTAVITYYFRSIGIVLSGAFILYALIQRKWKGALVFSFGFIILYLPWIIRNNIHNIKGRYMGSIMAVNPWRPEEGQLSSFGDFFDKMLVNFHDTVLKGFNEVLFPFVNFNEHSKSLVVVAGIITLFLTFYGAWRIKKLNYFLLLYLLGNIFVFLVWHSGNGSRYVWPLAPFIAYCFFYGIYELASQFLKNHPKLVTNIPIAILLIGFLSFPKLKEMNLKAERGYPAAYQNFFNIAESVKQANNDQLMVCNRKPGMFHYFSETFVCNYAWSPDDKKVISDMINKNVDYVVLDQLGYSSTARYLYPAIQKNPGLFKKVSQTKKPETYLLQFNKDLATDQLNNNSNSE